MYKWIYLEREWKERIVGQMQEKGKEEKVKSTVK